MHRCTISILVVLLALVHGCEVHGLVGTCECPFGCEPTPACPYPSTDPEPLPGTDEGGATTEAVLLDAGGGIISYGELWCARAEGATYSDPPNAALPIDYPDGSAPEGCQCIPFTSPVHDWIEDHEMGGSIVIEQAALEIDLGVANPLVDLLLETRDAIYADAILECVELVPPDATSNTCSDPSRYDVVPATPAFEPREIYRGNRDGEVDCFPVPEGIEPSCSFTAYASGIALSQGVYRVPRAVFQGFVQDPACLMVEGWSITLDASGAFTLAGVTTGSILARLGLRNDDHFVAITAGGDRVSLEDPWSAMHAYASLRTASSFSLELRRGSTTRIHAYRIMP